MRGRSWPIAATPLFPVFCQDRLAGDDAFKVARVGAVYDGDEANLVDVAKRCLKGKIRIETRQRLPGDD